jgi:hypothetical protein
MDNCQECRELWRAYGRAASAHITAAKELLRSMHAGDQNALKVHSQKEATAFSKMLELRRAIRQHEIDTHS